MKKETGNWTMTIRNLIQFLIAKIIYFFPYILILGIALGFVLAFIMGRVDFAIRGLALAIPGVTASLFLLYNNKQNHALEDHPILFPINNNILWLGFTTVFIFSIVSLYMTPFRSLHYFILISLLFCLVMVQIFSEYPNTVAILFQIILIMMNFIYGITLKYPLYYGGTDTFWHIYFTNIILLSGNTVPMDLSASYAQFPLYHIFLAQSAYLLDMSAELTLFVITCIPYAIVVLFIYLIFKYFTQNEQISLLTCLLYASTSVVMYYGPYAITRVFAYIGFVIFLYIMYTRANGQRKYEYSALTILFTIYIILVHQVSITQILILLMILFIIEGLYYSNKGFVDLRILTFVIVTFLSYWIYTSTDFFENLTLTRHDALSIDTFTNIKPSIQVGNELIFLWNNIDTSIMFFLIICGIGYVFLNSRRNVCNKDNYLVILGLFALATLIFYIPNPFQLFYTTMTLFRSDRIMLLLSPFFAFFMGCGIYLIISKASMRKNSLKLCAVTLLVLVFSLSFFSMILNNAPDAKDINFEQGKRYFSQIELSTFDHVFNTVPYGSYVSGDYPVFRYFVHSESSLTDQLGLPYYKRQYFDINYKNFNKPIYIIFREKEFMDRGISSQIGSYGPTYENLHQIRLNSLYANKIFVNGDINIDFLRTP